MALHPAAPAIRLGRAQTPSHAHRPSSLAPQRQSDPAGSVRETGSRSAGSCFRHTLPSGGLLGSFISLVHIKKPPLGVGGRRHSA